MLYTACMSLERQGQGSLVINEKKTRKKSHSRERPGQARPRVPDAVKPGAWLEEAEPREAGLVSPDLIIIGRLSWPMVSRDPVVINVASLRWGPSSSSAPLRDRRHLPKGRLSVSAESVQTPSNTRI